MLTLQLLTFQRLTFNMLKNTENKNEKINLHAKVSASPFCENIAKISLYMVPLTKEVGH